MQIPADSIQDYLSKVPEERKEAFTKLFETISKNLPKGFQTNLSYGMIGWSVPLETFPAGYHCSPGTPLPFINLASQKCNFCFAVVGFQFIHSGIGIKNGMIQFFGFDQHFVKCVKNIVDFSRPN